jgi:hypothetical protein
MPDPQSSKMGGRKPAPVETAGGLKPIWDDDFSGDGRQRAERAPLSHQSGRRTLLPGEGDIVLRIMETAGRATCRFVRVVIPARPACALAHL